MERWFALFVLKLQIHAGRNSFYGWDFLQLTRDQSTPSRVICIHFEGLKIDIYFSGEWSKVVTFVFHIYTIVEVFNFSDSLFTLMLFVLHS